MFVMDAKVLQTLILSLKPTCTERRAEQCICNAREMSSPLGGRALEPNTGQN